MSDILKGIKAGYFKVSENGRMVFDVVSWVKTTEGRAKFIEIIKSMPRKKP